MITLATPELPNNVKVSVEVEGGGFVLILRPVGDEDRLRDSALSSRYWQSDDPTEAGVWFVARDKLRKSAVIGWEGVQAPDGKPIPFDEKSFGVLLSIKGVRAKVVPIVNEHFEGKAVDPVALGKLQKSPEDSSTGDTSTEKFPTSSNGI